MSQQTMVPVLQLVHGHLPCQYHNVQWLKLYIRNYTQIKDYSTLMSIDNKDVIRLNKNKDLNYT